MKSGIRIGIDIGGTFTDFVIFDPNKGTLDTFKLLSTSDNPAIAVINGIKKIFNNLPIQDDNLSIHIIHGSTVATNALLERKGACTALITTQGFRDVLQIGRQNRSELYNLFLTPTDPLVPQKYRLEVIERIGTQGEVITPLETNITQKILRSLEVLKPESIAICLLFSFVNPSHEQEIADILRKAGYSVSVSSEILPEYREYERMSTTVVNAYVSPVLQRYLNTLEKSIGTLSQGDTQDTFIRVMQSNGGIIRLDEAQKSGVRCILSGPAGGVIGAQQIVTISTGNHYQTIWKKPELPALLNVLTLDMGGTSTDVSLIVDEPQVTTEAIIGGYPIRIPVLDIHTIGAGGGSIAIVDIGGVLRVGPESAGADPGPACYGKGTIPTVTDANLLLGRLQEGYFLGGQMTINLDRAMRAINLLAERLQSSISLKTEEIALGVIEIVNAHMERALRVISVERGYDPQDFTLLSFGGAGGLHAVDLARRLKIPKVLIPPLASTLSAFGMLSADIIRDYAHTVMYNYETPIKIIDTAFGPLVSKAYQDIQTEGISPEDIIIEKLLDLRYKGQSYEITIPYSEKYLDAFYEKYLQTYGTVRKEALVEVVNIRVRATGKVYTPHIPYSQLNSTDPTPAFIETRPVWFPNGPENVPLYRGDTLTPGNTISGPALVIRSDTTILVGINDQATVDGYYNLHIDIGV